MRKTCLSLIFALIFGVFSSLSSVVNAQDAPLLNNNRFGIHIVDESDLPAAAALVNSNGGQWGYVTLVIREDEMNIDRWRSAFNKMKELKLIPIVRIATLQLDGVWVKPVPEHAEKWAEFLGALPWPVKRRYVTLFNEPNHKHEWGGDINPSEYARIARRYWEELKKSSFDFFVLPAGFDAAAPNGPTTMDSKEYFDRMHEEDSFIFTLFDGWASHSYPNPGFSGNPSENGKMSVRGFEWETSYLAKYNLSDKTPVFITETGWRNVKNKQEQIASYYAQAFSEAWNNPKVIAVTPFLLRYTDSPFKEFSWQIPGTNTYYPYYEKVLGISKIPGTPEVNN